MILWCRVSLLIASGTPDAVPDAAPVIDECEPEIYLKRFLRKLKNPLLPSIGVKQK
jgi:hypothetical protein